MVGIKKKMLTVVITPKLLFCRAAKFFWADSLKQFMNIDSSSSMNELAELLLKGGKEVDDRPPNVHYREFLPAQHVSACEL